MPKTTFVPTNQIIGEYGNEQSFQYQKEGLDLEFFDTQSNYVDYLWEVLYRARNEARNGVLSQQFNTLYSDISEKSGNFVM